MSGFNTTKFFSLRFIRFGFWLALTVLSILFLLPQHYLVPDIFDWWDKLQHALAFGLLTLLGLLAYSTNKTPLQKQSQRIVVAMVLYGALIEVLQSVSGWRYGEFGDWAADVVGVLLAWASFVIVNRYIDRRVTGSL
jgi:VanZ family protein